MKTFLLSVHVLAAVLCVGPVTVAASIFPRYAVAAAAEGRSAAAAASAVAMHRISRVYAVLAISVPVFGLATAAAMGLLTQAWVLVSVALTAVAGLLLGLGVVPLQKTILEDVAAGTTDATGGRVQRLRMITGLFGLVWAVVVVLMIIRPGSTTGV